MTLNRAAAAAAPSDTVPKSVEEPKGDSAPLLLPPAEESSLGAGSLTEIAQLLCQAFRQDRREARSMAQYEERVIRDEGRKRVAEMRAQADDIRYEGYAQGIGEIAGGLLQGAGALQELPGEGETDPGKVLGSCGTISSGLGGVSAKQYKGAQADHEASAEEHRIASSAAERRAELWRDEAREAREMINKVLSSLQGLSETASSTRGAAILRA